MSGRRASDRAHPAKLLATVDTVRFKLGRPDLRRYDNLFAVPAAESGPLSVTFLGVASLLFDDGSSALLTDGFFSRPGLASVLTRPIAPDVDTIESCLRRAGITRLAAVIPVHSHYDHALDSAWVANRTGAVLAGGSSTANLGRGQRLADDRIITATNHQILEFGAYRVTFVESSHCPPDRFPGTIDEPVVSPARVSAYRCGEAWSLIVEHQPTGRTALVQGSAGFRPGALADQRAEVAYLGVGQLGLRPESEIEQYWRETVEAVGARRVVLIHWDDFFSPLNQPLRATACAGDDLDVSIRIMRRLAAENNVELLMPTVWRREDPWR